MKLIINVMIALVAVPMHLSLAAGVPNAPLPQGQQVMGALDALSETPLTHGDLNQLSKADLHEELGYVEGSFKERRLKAGIGFRNFQRNVNKVVATVGAVGGVGTGIVALLSANIVAAAGAITLFGWLINPEFVGPKVAKAWDVTVQVGTEVVKVGSWFALGGVLHLTTLGVLTYAMKKRIFIDLLEGKSKEARMIKWNPIDQGSRVATIVIDQKKYFLVQTGYWGKNIARNTFFKNSEEGVNASLYHLNTKGENATLELVFGNQPIEDGAQIRFRAKGLYVLEAGEPTLENTPMKEDDDFHTRPIFRRRG